tara:strand:+ start:104 stop:253 length:150 start_codon:yes stop_codon:yes gene_type:complete
MVGKLGQRPKLTYDKPPDKINKYFVTNETSFRNKMRLWKKLLERNKNVK